MEFNFAQDLFLEVQELNRFKRSLSEDGWKRFLSQIVTQYGVIYTKDSSGVYTNDDLKVVEGTSPDKLTIKAGSALLPDGNTVVIESDLVDHFTQPSDTTNRNIVIRYASSSLEEGTVDISVDGTLTGIGTKFTEVLRGQNNFAVKIKFPNSTNNTQEYVVHSITNDTSALLNVNGLTSESGQEYEVIGAFSPGVSVPEASKRPYLYDSYEIELTTSSIDEDTDLLLGRAAYNGAASIIIDDRFGAIVSGNQRGDTLDHNLSFNGLELVVPKEGNIFQVDLNNPIISYLTYRPYGEELFLKFTDGGAESSVDIGKATGVTAALEFVDSKPILNPNGSFINFSSDDVAHFMSLGDDGWVLVNINIQLSATTFARKGSANTFTASNTFSQSIVASDGITENGNSIKRKIVNIGDWDMDNSGSVNVAHGLTFTNIRSIDVTIRDDSNSTYYNGLDRDVGVYITWDATNIVLTAAAAGTFDNANFNSTSYNRGWVVITYI